MQHITNCQDERHRQNKNPLVQCPTENDKRMYKLLNAQLTTLC